MTLAELLEPAATVAQFRLGALGKAPLHVPGSATRFEHLVAARLLRDLELELDAPARSVDMQLSPESVPVTADLWLLQLEGRTDLTVSPPAKSSTATSSLAVSMGEALYVPAGWRLAGRAAVGSALWLEVRQPTGRDLIGWLVPRLLADEAFDAALPRFAPPAEQADFLDGLRRRLAGALRAPDLMVSYSRAAAGAAPLRAPLSQPLDVSAASASEATIDFLPTRRLSPRRTGATSLALRFAGERMVFPLEAADLLAFLEQEAPVSLDRFCAAFEAEFERDALLMFIDELVAQGLAALLPA